LPFVPGRHDVLIRDFFVFDRAGLGTGQNINVVSSGSNDSEVITKSICEKLKLQAIDLGQTPQAFINDRLLTIGDKINVVIGGTDFNCEVIGIEKDMVIIRCREMKVVLKLSQQVQIVQ
jgi:hypothetical protein